MIAVVLGDLADAQANALMRPVSAEWDPVTPATRRLEAQAGAVVEAQWRRLGELPIGSAVLTPAAGVAAEFVIHVIVRSMTEPVRESAIQRGLQNGLRRCVEWGVDRCAVPALGTGAGNLDAEDVAGLMVPLLFDHMRSAPYPKEVLLMAASEYEQTAFRQALRRLELRILPKEAGS